MLLRKRRATAASWSRERGRGIEDGRRAGAPSGGIGTQRRTSENLAALPAGKDEREQAEDAGVEVRANNAEEAGGFVDDVAGEGTEVKDAQKRGEGEQGAAEAATAVKRGGVGFLEEKHDGGEKDDEVVAPGDRSEEGGADDGEDRADWGCGAGGVRGALWATVEEAADEDGEEDEEVAARRSAGGRSWVMRSLSWEMGKWRPMAQAAKD